MLRLVGLLGAVAVTGAALGVALERTGSVDVVAEREVRATLDAVPFSSCPGEIGVGDLHRGDRVYLTGRTEDASWLELRAPFEVSDRVWVESVWVFADESVEELPVVKCARSVGAESPLDPTLATTIEPEDVASPSDTASDASTTTAVGTTNPAPADSSTMPATSVVSTTTTMAATTTTMAATTTTMAATTTTVAATTTTVAATTTTVAATTTTTTVADTSGPSVDLLGAQPPDIWEDANFGGCPTQPHSSSVTVAVADQSGVADVVLSYDTGRGAVAVGMSASGGGIYAATVGPFTGDEVDADGPVALTISATDTNGNRSVVSDTGAITLHDCAIG